MSADTTFSALFAAGFNGGLPEPDTAPGPCELCGHVAPRHRWRPGGNWSAYDQHAFPGEGALCPGCHLLVTGRCPDLGPSGKPMRWTLLSLATDGRRSMWATKAHKRRIAGWLRDPDLAVSVADGGKKHIAFRAPTPRAGYMCAAIDAQDATVPMPVWVELADAVETAYRRGVPKSTLETGRLDATAYNRLGVADADALQTLLDRHRSSPTLRLAVWVAQHEE